MPPNRLSIIILAAGKGTRMQSSLPKVMHRLAQRPMLSHVISTAESLAPDQIVVVVGPDMQSVVAQAAPYPTVLQSGQLGTGDAVRAALPSLDRPSDVLVLYGDTPLVEPETLRRMLEERRRTSAAVVVLGMRVAPPVSYGRLVLDRNGNLSEIVEAAEASPATLALDLCNSGVMAIDGAALPGLLERLTPSPVKGEFYLTDLVSLARRDGRIARVIEAPAAELAGVDSRAGLAAAEAALQAKLRARALACGVTLTDPSTVWFSADTKLGRDVTIEPNVLFGPGVTIEDGVAIKSFCHIEGALIRTGSIIGPFARLRPGSAIGPDAHVGNFVELKNAVLGEGAKANHLTYLGDATIGAGSNIGAGTITCNYDGFFKYRTDIGSDVFIGSNSALVAPLRVGDGALIAAGSTVTRDVPADAIVLARGEQIEKPGQASRFRAMKRRQKDRQSVKG